MHIIYVLNYGPGREKMKCIKPSTRYSNYKIQLAYSVNEIGMRWQS